MGIWLSACRFARVAALLLICGPSVSGQDHLSPALSDAAVIARVGTRDITVKEFRDSYEFGPAFVKQSQTPKKTHLEKMINEKLIALDGYAARIDTFASVKRMLKEIEDDLVVTEWYRHTIVPLVVIDSAQIESGIQQQEIDLRFRYISAGNETDIRDVKQQLDSGGSFDSLYTHLKTDPRFIVDEVPINFFRLWRVESQIADTLSHMKPGVCSDVIRESSGFFLVRMESAQKQALITATQYEALRRKAYEYYSAHALDSVTRSYIKGVMERCRPTISGAGLRTTFRLLGTIAGQVHESELQMQSDPWAQILVKSDCENYSIRDFAVWYSFRPQHIDFAKPTASSARIIKELIFSMVRDKRLIRIARAEGFGEDVNVLFETAHWEDKLVYWKQKAAAVEQPQCEEEAVRRFYDENKRKFGTDSSGNPVSYEQVRSKVKEDALLMEYSKRLFRYVNSLRQRFVVTIDEEVLNSVQVSDAGLSKKIEVMILKKEGTLPRQAFPTIDNEWLFF